MSMNVMFKRIGPYFYDDLNGCCQQVTMPYYKECLKSERITLDLIWKFKIKARQKWEHRFFGVTKEGIPIWAKKYRQYRYIDSDLCGAVAPYYQNLVYKNDKECKSEEVISFTKWKRNNKKLAFIYLGIFWTLEDGETLNDAARRFINSHPEVKAAFIEEKEKREVFYVGENEIYIYTIFMDGALIFQDGIAYLHKDTNFVNTICGLWAIMAAEGFFAKEDIKAVDVGSKFIGWYRDKCYKKD